MLSVALIAGSASSQTSAAKEWAEQKPSRIETKIFSIDAFVSCGSHKRLKWRIKRGVIALRPPPGGPQAAMNEVFCTALKKSFFKTRVIGIRSEDPDVSEKEQCLMPLVDFINHHFKGSFVLC